MPDDLERLRQRKQQRPAHYRVGAFNGPSGAKRATINRVMLQVEAAADLRDIADGKKAPTPERITMALNLCDLYGPEVDQMLDGEEPMVDEWESGERIPTFEQMQKLAELTGYPVRFFYQPPPPQLGPGWICGTGGCAPL